MSGSQSDKYNKIKDIVSDELIVIEEKMLSAICICEPLNSHIKNFLLAPSKRIRPVLTILYLKAQNFELSKVQLEMLAAIELVHNASLIHDDIIDQSNLRRGNKTINAEFGNKLGVIAGDYLLSVAMEKIAGINNTDVLKNFSQTLRQMCIGEINQNFSRYKIGTIEEYIEKSKNKTAYLFDCAVKSSLLLSNIDNSTEFGINFGIAFQIRDDLLNLLKKDKSKPAADIEEGIYTAPVIFAQSVDNFIQGIEKTKDLLNNYLSKAKEAIETFDNNIYTKALAELLELLKNE